MKLYPDGAAACGGLREYRLTIKGLTAAPCRSGRYTPFLLPHCYLIPHPPHLTHPDKALFMYNYSFLLILSSRNCFPLLFPSLPFFLLFFFCCFFKEKREGTKIKSKRYEI